MSITATKLLSMYYCVLKCITIVPSDFSKILTIVIRRFISNHELYKILHVMLDPWRFCDILNTSARSPTTNNARPSK